MSDSTELVGVGDFIIFCLGCFTEKAPGRRRQVLVSRVKFEGALAGSMARWPLRGCKKSAGTTVISGNR